MNIKGINNISSINYYKKISSNKVNNYGIEKKEKDIDRIEISQESKILLENKINNKNYDENKVNNIKAQIANGTYTYDAKQIAEGILESMKGLK